MAQRVQIPILILTGFLGSGKTSLLSKWLRAPEFEGAMVVVNELGEVGLDDRLVQHSSEVPLLLENGCACCEAAEDLNATLERLFWQRLHRAIPKFNWVLIETTGIADPAQLAASITGHELINERYRIAGIITTFDAKRGPALFDAHAECRSQLRMADTVIVTKTDIASDADVTAAQEVVHKVRPDVEILASAQGDLSAGALLGTLAQMGNKSGMDSPQGEYPHDRTHHHHAHAYATAFAALPDILDWARLAAVMDAVVQDNPKHLLRLKGTARTGADGSIEVVQAIAGEALNRQALTEDETFSPVHQDKNIQTGLTVITKGTGAEQIAADIVSRLANATLPAHSPLERKVKLGASA